MCGAATSHPGDGSRAAAALAAGSRAAGAGPAAGGAVGAAGAGRRLLPRHARRHPGAGSLPPSAPLRSPLLGNAGFWARGANQSCPLPYREQALRETKPGSY